MAKEKIIKKVELGLNTNLSQYWHDLLEYVSNNTGEPSSIVTMVLRSINYGIQFWVFFILLGQSIHILNTSEKRFINLRHLLIKWIFLLIMIQLVASIRHHTTYDQLFVLMCYLFALLMIYPSKAIKTLHLKYFSQSQKKKYDQTMEDLAYAELSLFGRLLVSIVVFFLKCSKLILVFIHPSHRKKIQDAIRGVNMVLVEQKYFWKIYDSNSTSTLNSVPNLMSNSNTPQNKLDLKKSEVIKQLASMKPVRQGRQNIIRAQVAEYISLTLSGLANTLAPSANRRFTFYRNIEIVYNIQTTQLTIINEDDGKSSLHSLTELVIVEDLIVQLICEDEDEIYVKFKSKKQMELFMNSIYLQT